MSGYNEQMPIPFALVPYVSFHALRSATEVNNDNDVVSPSSCFETGQCSPADGFFEVRACVLPSVLVCRG